MKKKLLFILSIVIHHYSISAQTNINKNLQHQILRDAQEKNKSILEIKSINDYDFLNHLLVVEFQPTGWCLIKPSLPDNYRVASNYQADWEIDTNESRQVSWLQLFDYPGIASSNNHLKGGDKKVTPLLTTNWSQACMPDGIWGTKPKPVSGCVATAMAQVMFYFGNPTQGYGTMKNHYGEVEVRADFNNNFNFADMPLGNKAANCTDSKAELFFDCGVLAQANYGVVETGADTRTALNNLSKHFNYAHFSLGKFENADRHRRIMDHLNRSIPIIVAGKSDSGGGHAFVLDGYDPEQGYHFNMGWDVVSNNTYYSVDHPPFHNDLRIYFNLYPLATVRAFPYISDLMSLSDWGSKGDVVTTGQDEESKQKYAIIGNATDLELVYQVPTNQVNPTLMLDLEKVLHKETPSSYAMFTINVYDYYNGEVKEIKNFYSKQFNNASNTINEQIIKSLKDYKGHLLKFHLNLYASGANAPKMKINNFQVINTSAPTINKAVAKNNRIELTFSSNLVKDNYNASYFTIKHGSFEYPATKVETLNGQNQSPTICLYTNYTIKQGDKVRVKYKAKSTEGALKDSDGAQLMKEYNKELNNQCTHINNKLSTWHVIDNDDPTAYCKLKFKDQDGDLLKVKEAWDIANFRLKAAGNNCYYIYADLEKLKGVMIYVMIEDFSGIQTSYSMDLEALVVPTAMDRTQLEDILLYPNPASSAIKLNVDCSRINIYDLSGKLALSVNNYLQNNQVTIAALKPGIYLVEAKTKTRKVHFKLIKQ